MAKKHTSSAHFSTCDEESARRLTTCELNRKFGLSQRIYKSNNEQSTRLPQRPLPIDEYVQQALKTLGISYIIDRKRGYIELYDKTRYFRNWFNSLDIKVCISFAIITVETYRSPSEKRQGMRCRTLSALKAAISAIQKEKIRRTFSEREKEQIKRISPWSVASAIVFTSVVERGIRIRATDLVGQKWYHQWVSPCGRKEQAVGFDINIPLRFEKGLSMVVDDMYEGSLVIFINSEKGVRLTRLEQLHCQGICAGEKRNTHKKALRVGRGGSVCTTAVRGIERCATEASNPFMTTKAVYLI